MKKIPQLSDLSDEDVPDESVPSARPDDGASASPDAASRRAAAPDSAATAGADSAATAGARHETTGESPGGGGPAGEGAGGRGAPAPRRRARGGKKPARGPARRFARERALQALYQWDMADAESSTVRREFVERQDMSRVDVEYFERLFRGVSHDVEKVDATLADALDRPLAEVDPIERAVLRIAAYELAEVLETPARVVINEGVEITKRFGADNGHRYVNGVLDGLATTLRPLEMHRG